MTNEEAIEFGETILKVAEETGEATVNTIAFTQLAIEALRRTIAIDKLRGNTEDDLSQ